MWLQSTEAEIVLRMMVAHNCTLTSLDVQILDNNRAGLVWDEPLDAILTRSAALLSDLVIDARIPWTRCLAQGTCLPALCKLEAWIQSDEELVCICSAAPNLRSINLKLLGRTGTGLEVIGRLSPQLESLALSSGNSEMSIPNINEGLIAITVKCTHLKHLTLHYLPNLTAEGLTVVFTHCTQLQELVVQGCAALNDHALMDLSLAARATLQSLSLHTCCNVRGIGIMHIAMSCPHLHTLALHRTARVDASA